MPPASPTLIEVDRDLVESLRFAVLRPQQHRPLRTHHPRQARSGRAPASAQRDPHGRLPGGVRPGAAARRHRRPPHLQGRGDRPRPRPARAQPHPQGRPPGHARSARAGRAPRSHRGARAAPGGGALVTLVQLATQRTFRSLRIRNYRLFFFGQLVSVSGTWMQQLAQDWLVLRLTNRSLPVGITTALQFAPVLVLGIWGGLIADRGDKRRLLLATQGAMGALALALGVLTATGAVRLWMIYLLALLLGCVTSFDMPARQSFVTEMVGSKD